MKFSPILSRSGSSLAISSISGRALANLSVDARINMSSGEDKGQQVNLMMHDCTATL